jgi:hypothetical protein
MQMEVGVIPQGVLYFSFCMEVYNCKSILIIVWFCNTDIDLYANSVTVWFKIFQITWIHHGEKRTTKATNINFVSGMIA